jgi:putative peptidoglycan lipid II flippase
MERTPAQSNRQIARAAGTVMLAFIFSQLVGLATKILIARAFNAQVELDAFYVSNRPSETLLTIMAGGILASSFIPIFVKFLVKQDRQSAWKLASGTANTILVILTVLAGLMALLANPIIRYLLGVGFPPEKQALAVDLLRIQALSVIFFGLSALVIGILNSNQKFLMSALAPAMYQLGQILGILFLAPSMGIYGLAWGVVLGSVMNLLIQIPSLLKLRGQYFFTFGMRDSSVMEVFRLMLPRMFGAAVVQLMLWVNTLLASQMVSGTVFSLSSGFTLMMMAQAAIAQSVATAVMPTFSAQYAQGKYDDIRKTLASALRGVILLSVPATAGLIILGISIIAFLYPTQDSQMIAWALTWYAAGLVFHSVLEVLVRAYYAMHDTKTPVLVGASAMALSIGLSLVLAPLFSQLGWLPHGGLALAVSVSTALEVTTLFFILRKRLNGIHGSEIATGFGAAVVGTLCMSAVLIFWLQLTKTHTSALKALGGVAIGATIYTLSEIALRLPEISSLFQAIKRRLPGLNFL